MNDPSGLYLLLDGTHAAPGDCSKDDKGVLRHSNGIAVALYEDGSPQTVGKDAEVNKNVEAAAAGKAPVPEPKPVEVSQDQRVDAPAREPSTI